MRLAELRRSDLLFAGLLVTFTALAASVWWLSAIVPGQDYPQFLVLVRAVQDMGNPTSLFHGTYVSGAWFTPLALPIHLTILLAKACGGSIEVAGRLLMTAQSVGLVAASLFLLRVLGRSRWAVFLLFPVVHSVWTVVGGFVGYATALPLVVLGWALTVRWLARLDLRSGIALAICLCTTLLWHGIAYVQLGLGFAVLWALWRAPSRNARFVSVVPTIPSLLQYAVWMVTEFGSTSHPGQMSWLSPREAIGSLVRFVWASVPDASLRAFVLAFLVVAGLLLSRKNSPAALWRFREPFLVVAATYLVAYFVLPINLNRVEGFSNRFPYVAVLAFVFAWKLPSRPAGRRILLSAILVFGGWCLVDVALRFRAFDAETRGASKLMDRVGVHETLYYWPERRGFSEAFGGAGNKAMIELEQYTTIRQGGLPNSSFAGYGLGYVRYVDGKNPMPGLHGSPWSRPEVTRFDYVLSRRGQARPNERFRLVDSADGWELYGVCGGHAFPVCL